jgi:hypothetical protein
MSTLPRLTAASSSEEVERWTPQAAAEAEALVIERETGRNVGKVEFRMFAAKSAQIGEPGEMEKIN